MDQLDTQYQEVGESAGVPRDVMHRLTPDEMRLFACLVEHRNRIVAEPELALHVFGHAGNEERRRLNELIFPVRFAVYKYGMVPAMLTHYRGRLALGIQWRPKTSGGETPAAVPVRGADEREVAAMRT